MQFTIFTANCTSKASNCDYPNKVEVTSAEVLQEAVKKDHVCASYKENKRGNDNFISSDVIVMDIDNDHTDDPSEYITESKMDELFPDINYCLVPSRHHMLEKGSHPAAPRYHVMFPVEVITDATQYAKVKELLYKNYPFFDGNALDAARFLYGSEVGEVIWHEGWMSITDELEDGDLTLGEPDDEEFDAPTHCGPILEGSRNKTLSHYAGRILKKYGLNDDRAFEVFMEYVAKCDPPLPKEEIATIWNSATHFYKTKVMTSDGYIPPEEYNDEFGSASLKPEDYSDIGEAKVLSREYGNELKFTNATDYLRYDGDRWCEDKQLAVDATEEFLDLQLADAEDAVESAVKALVTAGVDEVTARAGGKDLEKACTTPKLLKLYFMLLGAKTYLKFVQKRRDYKYIVSTMNAAKPMLAINVTDLDKDPFLINTPEATIDMTKGLAGKKEHDPADLITKITACSPSEVGKAIWEDALDTFFLGDKELIEYVQMTVGSAAVGKVFQEHMIIAYDGMFILFKTGLRISEFCGLTLSDIDFEEKQISVNYPLQRTRDMKYVIEDTKTSSGTRIIPMTEEVYECFKRIVENRKKPKKEPVIDGYKGFLFLDKKDIPEVALHWEKHFEWALAKHNRIYKEQLPKITPHVCRYTYCSNMAKSGMNPKTLQYLMGHSDIGVTLNTYTHLGAEDAKEELGKYAKMA